MFISTDKISGLVKLKKRQHNWITPESCKVLKTLWDHFLDIWTAYSQKRISNRYSSLKRILRDHWFSTYAKFSEKITKITYVCVSGVRTLFFRKILRMCAYQGVRNVIFSENFAYVLNEWSLNSVEFKPSESLLLTSHYSFFIADFVFSLRLLSYLIEKL